VQETPVGADQRQMREAVGFRHQPRHHHAPERGGFPGMRFDIGGDAFRGDDHGLHLSPSGALDRVRGDLRARA
jgi:hypothetical protein